MSAGPHTISPHLPQVKYHLSDILPLVKMRKIKGQMEGLTVAETKVQVSCTVSPLATHAECLVQYSVHTESLLVFHVTVCV